MKPEILKALKESVSHWESNLTLAKEGRFRAMRVFGEDCSLCNLTHSDGPGCSICPVAQRTGQGGCLGTPWDRIDYLLTAARNLSGKVGGEAAAQALVEQCQEEVKFLRSLLPIGEKM